MENFVTSGWYTGKVFWLKCNVHKQPSFPLVYKIQCIYDKLVWISRPSHTNKEVVKHSFQWSTAVYISKSNLINTEKGYIFEYLKE